MKYQYRFKEEDLEPLKPKPKVIYPNKVKCPYCFIMQRFPDSVSGDDYLEKNHYPRCRLAKKNRA